jgi:hypothetical protein
MSAARAAAARKRRRARWRSGIFMEPKTVILVTRTTFKANDEREHGRRENSNAYRGCCRCFVEFRTGYAQNPVKPPVGVTK